MTTTKCYRCSEELDQVLALKEVRMQDKVMDTIPFAKAKKVSQTLKLYEAPVELQLPNGRVPLCRGCFTSVLKEVGL